MADFDDDDLSDLEEGQPEAADAAADTGDASGTTAAAAGGNRNFMLAIGILGAVFVLLVIALVASIVWLRPGQNVAQRATNEAIEAQNQATVSYATQVADELAQLQAVRLTPSVTTTPLPPTATLVLAKPSVTPTTASGGDQARTATVAALLTQAAQSKITVTGTPATATATTQGKPGAGNSTSPSATALPKTGFAEDVGLPGLFGLAGVLIAIIWIARRLRVSTGS